MPVLKAYVSCDTAFFDEINGEYTIGKFRLIPCKIRKRNQILGRANFILNFNFDGAVTEDEVGDGFTNRHLSYEEGKRFVAWLSLISRTYIDLSYQVTGHSMLIGPASTHKLDEEITDEYLENVFHKEKEYKKGKYYKVSRPNYEDKPFSRSDFMLPSDASDFTEKLYNLPNSEKEKFFDACFSYQFALQHSMRLPSVSLVSLVNCVEAIMRDETSSGYCRDAKRNCSLMYDVMKKFRRFFSDNIQYPLPKEKKKFLEDVYASRSSFVHQALMGHGVVRGPEYGGYYNRELKEQLSEFETLVNVGLITWLQRI